MARTVRCRCGRRLEVKEDAETIVCPGCMESFRVTGHGEEFRLAPVRDGKERPQPLEIDLPDELALDEPVGPRAARRKPSREPDEEETAVVFVPVREAIPTAWWRYLKGAGAYPFTGTAKWTLSFWLFCDLLFWLLFSHPLFTEVGPSLVLGFSALLIKICLFGMLAFYEFSLVNRSAWDPDQLPSLPAFQDAYESLLRPIGLLLAALAASAVPYYLLLVPTYVFGPALPALRPYLLTAGQVLFVLLLPMNLLAVATADQVRALYPQHTLPAVWRALGPYLVLCALCTVILGAGHVATALLISHTEGSYLARLAREVTMVYLLTVCARALGTFYAAYAERMGWLREAE